MPIHSSAVIDEVTGPEGETLKPQIGENVTIGPFVYVGPHVVIEDDVVLEPMRALRALPDLKASMSILCGCGWGPSRSQISWRARATGGG